MRSDYGEFFVFSSPRTFRQRAKTAYVDIMDSATAQNQPSEINDPPANLETTTAKHGASDATTAPDTEEPPSKKVRLEDDSERTDDRDAPRRRGVAPMKAEYVLSMASQWVTSLNTMLC